VTSNTKHQKTIFISVPILSGFSLSFCPKYKKK